MRLKTITAICMIAGLLMLGAWPWIVGAKPGPGAPRPELAAYAVRFAEYIIVLLILFSVTAVLAYYVMRQQQDEYRREAQKNLKELIEGTLEDHGRKDDAS